MVGVGSERMNPRDGWGLALFAARSRGRIISGSWSMIRNASRGEYLDAVFLVRQF